MSDTIVKLQIKVTGSNSFKEVEVSADELAKAIDQVKGKTDQLASSLINSNQIVQAFEQVSSAVRGLQSVMHSLTDAYAVQAQAETKLATVMRNTMDATDDEIQSIKNLASAQQQLGVVGDEVQLSGAQELATYLGKKESLEKLIPVMNDMIAQQYGYNATAESAVGIATMMGKVMEGQTKALSRYGYSFTEAQEEILKFGTEEERAATLAEVIEQSVGGVNAALAATPYGKIVQANNKFGDLKETLGAMIAPAMTFVDNIARISIAVAGLGKGIATIKSLGASIRALGVHSKVTATAQRLLATAGISAAAGTTALRMAVTALYAAMTLGLSLAIQGIITLITSLAGKSRDAAEGMEELKEANEAYKSAVGQAKAEIETEIAALKRLIDANTDTTDAVRKLNEKYAEVFGNHQTASEWYDILTQKSQLYCRQLGYEAKAKSLASAIGAKMTERDDLQKEYDKAREEESNRSGISVDWWWNKSSLRIGKKIKDLDDEIGIMTAEMNSAFGEAGKAADSLKGKVNGVAEAVSWQQMNYTDLGKAVSEQKKKVESLIGVNGQEAEAEGAILQAMQKRYDELGKQLDKVTGKAKNADDILQRATVELTPALAPKTSSQLPIPGEVPVIQASVGGFRNLEQINRRIQDLQQQRLQASRDEIPAIDALIAHVEQLRDEFEGISKAKAPEFSQAWSGIKGVGIRFDNFHIAQSVGNIALTVILLAGGMETDFRSIKPVLRQGIILSTLGVLFTVAFTGGFIWFLSTRMPQALPFGVLGCFLLAAAMSSTDSASVFNILRGSRLSLKNNLGSVLELESGSNDPVAYVLTITLVQIITAGNAPKTPVVVLTLLFQILIGAGIGVGMGYLGRWMIKRIRLRGSALYAIMVLCLGFLTNAVAADLKGNGLLALYIAAIILGNDKKLPFKKDVLKFLDGVTWLAQILMFLLLGLLVNPSELPKVAFPAILIAVFMSLVARPLSVLMLMAPFKEMNWRGKSFVSWVGLKGAAPILFAIYPVVANVPEAKDMFNIVFFITLLSLLFQGTTIPFAAKLLKVGEKAEGEVDTMGIEMPDEMGTLTNHIVTKKDLSKGNLLKDLNMPLGKRVIMIKRGDDFIMPDGGATLMEGDQMLILESYSQNET